MIASNAAVDTTPYNLARYGLRVFPLHNPAPSGGCSCRDADCPTPGRHPRIKGWQQFATTDPAQIRRWQREWSYANWGYLTGAQAGIVVADFDSSEAYREAERRYGPLPSTWTVISRRGSHLLFDHPGGFIKSGPVDAIPGLDIKADSSGGGALAVAPGSRHRSGNLYAFEVSGHPEDMPRAGAPAWIADLANARRQPVRSGEELHVIPDGRRNSTLLHHAGKLRRSGYTVEEIGPMLHAINERRCDPPLYSHEVDGITARAADWDAGEFELGPERGELERELMEARRRLEEERTAHSEMMAVLRNPNIKTERGTAIAAVLELNHKVAKGETVTLPGRGGGWVRMPTARIAEQAGIAKPQNAAGHVKRLAEWGVFDRTIETKQATEIDAETGEVTSSHVMRELYLRPRQSLPDTLAMLATLDPADPLTKGGNRHGGERLICPDHPDAGTVKRWTLHCQECDRQLDSGDEYHRPTPETPYTQVGSTKQEASAGAFLYTQLGSTEDAPDPLPRPTIANHPENAL